MRTWPWNPHSQNSVTPGAVPPIRGEILNRSLNDQFHSQWLSPFLAAAILITGVASITSAAVADETAITSTNQSNNGQKNGDWIQRTEKGVELLFNGRVLNTDGSLAQAARVRVIDHPMPMTNDRRVRDVSLRNGAFSFGSIGLSNLSVWASSADGSEQAFQFIAKQEVAAVARSEGIELKLEPARLLAVGVKNAEGPVGGAQVVVRAGYDGDDLKFSGETAENGIASIYLPKIQLLNAIQAWTADRQLGVIDFRYASDRDRKKTFHRVELSDCKPLTVRVLNEQGVPQSSLPLRLGIGNSRHVKVDDMGLFETITDNNGEATFDYFPGWDDEWHYVYTNDSGRFINRDPQVIEGVEVYTLGSYEPTIDASIQLDLPDQCPGGMIIEGRSFQCKEEHGMTVFLSRIDDQGQFEAPVVPGYTYNLFLNDRDWVSKPLAAILADPETRTATPPDLEIVRGADVTVKVTAGPGHVPLSGQWVRFETPHLFTWKEDGKTRTGGGGRRWRMITDANGEVQTRAYPGLFHTGVSTGSSNVEKKVTIDAHGVNELELHRETAGPTYVTGRLVSNAPTAMLDGARVTIDQAESSLRRPKVQAVADAMGEFEARVDCSLAIAYARTADGKFSGATHFWTNDKEFQIELIEVGRVGGQVLDDQGIPIAGGEVSATATLRPFDKPDDAGDHWPRILFAESFETTTDKDGRFLFNQLPAQTQVLIRLHTNHTSPHTLRSLDGVFLDPGESREDKVYRPRGKAKLSIEDQLAKLLSNCRCMHTHGLVLIGGDGEAVERLRRKALNYEAHPDVLWYLPFFIDLAENTGHLEEKQELLERRSWAMPKENELLLVVVDGAGNEVGQLLVSSAIDASANENTQAIAAFLSEHRIPQQDAREKLAMAIAEAKRSGRRVWARVSGTRCGPCIRMSNWLEEQRTPIEKAFVLVEIDTARDRHGAEVAKQLKHAGGIPWHVMLDAEGQILVTSESPIGNIGSPAPTPDSLKHVRHLFTEAAGDLLTAGEIAAILDTIN